MFLLICFQCFKNFYIFCLFYQPRIPSKSYSNDVFAEHNCENIHQTGITFSQNDFPFDCYYFKKYSVFSCALFIVINGKCAHQKIVQMAVNDHVRLASWCPSPSQTSTIHHPPSSTNHQQNRRINDSSQLHCNQRYQLATTHSLHRIYILYSWLCYDDVCWTFYDYYNNVCMDKWMRPNCMRYV